MSRKQWRCFFCDEVFKTAKDAAEHFGCEADAQHSQDPVCCWQKDLVRYVLQLEQQNRELQEERDPVMRAWYDVMANHSKELINAEQKGYDKGVADMKKQGYCVEPAKHEV